MRYLCALFVLFALHGKEIDNQSHQNLSHMPSIFLGEAGICRVPMVKATEESLKGYGRIVHDFDAEEVMIETWPAPGWRNVFPGTGDKGGIVEDSFTMFRKGNVLYAENHAVKRFYITGWFDDPGFEIEDPDCLGCVYAHEANYHPDGGQVFFPADGKPFVALLALPGDDVRPEDFVAFYFDGSFGVQIEPNVWHQPMFPVGESALFRNKQGAVHACIGVDFVEEFGVYLEISLQP